MVPLFDQARFIYNMSVLPINFSLDRGTLSKSTNSLWHWCLVKKYNNSRTSQHNRNRKHTWCSSSCLAEWKAPEKFYVHFQGDDSDEGEFDADFEMKKQKLRAQEFENEYKKKKTAKLKPRVYGPLWIGCKDDARPPIVLEQLFKILSPFRAVSLTMSQSIPTSFNQPTSSPGK